MIPIVQDLKPLLDDYGHRLSAIWPCCHWYLRVLTIGLAWYRPVAYRNVLCTPDGCAEQQAALADGKISENSTCSHHWCKTEAPMNRGCSMC